MCVCQGQSGLASRCTEIPWLPALVVEKTILSPELPSLSKPLDRASAGLLLGSPFSSPASMPTRRPIKHYLNDDGSLSLQIRQCEDLSFVLLLRNSFGGSRYFALPYIFQNEPVFLKQKSQSQLRALKPHGGEDILTPRNLSTQQGSGAPGFHHPCSFRPLRSVASLRGLLVLLHLRINTLPSKPFKWK